MSGQGLAADALTAETADRFLAARRAAGYVLYLSPKALVPLLGFLRRTGAVPEAPPAPAGPADELLGRYQRYLVTDEASVPGRQPPTRLWCGRSCPPGWRCPLPAWPA